MLNPEGFENLVPASEEEEKDPITAAVEEDKVDEEGEPEELNFDKAA